MVKIGKGFKIVAMMDGTTLNGYLRVENCPLVQRYSKGATECVPNFETMPELERPVLVPIVKDSQGNWLSVRSAEWSHNYLPIEFPEGSDVSKDGMFKKLRNYKYNYTATEQKTATLALRVMKNFYILGSNMDNDTIGCSCTVEVNGQSVSVENMTRDVVIEETSGEPWSVRLDNADINDNVSSVTMKPLVYKNGKELKSLEGLNFKWYKLDETGFVHIGSAQTQIIRKEDVNGSLMVKVELLVDNSTFSATATVEDYTDTRYVDFMFEGLTGDLLSKGNTAIVTPVARFRSNGNVDPAYNQWDFFIKDNAGNPLRGKGEKFTDTKFSITYNEVMEAGGGISGYARSVKEG